MQNYAFSDEIVLPTLAANKKSSLTSTSSSGSSGEDDNDSDLLPTPNSAKSSEKLPLSPPLPTLTNKSNNNPYNNDEKVLSPSEGAYETGNLQPCETCGRTFNAKALERHIKVCEKVSTKKRAAFDPTKKRLEGLDIVPRYLSSSKRKNTQLFVMASIYPFQ